MEIVVTRSNENTDELQHHGTKGMKWGQRLYQNKDGSLTALGKKRYNKQVEKLKAEEAKIKAAEKAAKTKAKNQAKFDKLDEKKADLDARKKALKGKTDKDKDDKQEETLDQKRERLLKSTDPKEIYKDRDVLTYNELNDRISRINLENQLMSKIPAETHKTGKDFMDNASKNIESATNLYRSVDNAFSAVKNSTIGKTVAKYMGLDEVNDAFDFDSFNKNRDKKSLAKLKEADERLKYYDALDKYNKKQNGGDDDDPIVEDYDTFVKNIDSKTAKELKEYNEALSNKEKILGRQKRYQEEQEEVNQNNDKTDKSDKSDKKANDSNETKQSESNKDKQNKQNKQSEKKASDASNKKKDDGEWDYEEWADSFDRHDKQNKQSEPKKEKQSEKKSDPEPEIIEPTKFKQKSSDNSNKKKGEDISDYVSWKDVSDDDSPARKSVNEVVKKSGSVKLSNADYKQYEKDIKAWREKYDSEDSPYSQKQMLDALYEIEKEHGISWRRLGEG